MLVGDLVALELPGKSPTLLDGALRWSTFTTTGTTLFFLPGSLQLIRGPLVFEFDANGDATITIVSSSVTDVCTVLSDP